MPTQSNPSVAILAMIYHEPEWLNTIGSIQRHCPGVPVFFAERNGVGGLAGPFNEAFAANRLVEFDYVWFLTNFSFTGPLLKELVRTAVQLKTDHRVAAIHPAFASDHRFLRPAGNSEVTCVPFVEFTAPLVDTLTFAKNPLDDYMPYTGHDIDWGHRVREDGEKLFCYTPSPAVTVQHGYLRHSKSEHPATALRKKKREEAEVATVMRLRHKYGDNWRDLLNYKGGI